jgi:hypothetical protein
MSRGQQQLSNSLRVFILGYVLVEPDITTPKLSETIMVCWASVWLTTANVVPHSSFTDFVIFVAKNLQATSPHFAQL